MKILIPDRKATEEINLNRLYLERSIRNAEFFLEEAKKDEEKAEAEKALQETREALEKFEPAKDDPVVVVGCLPTSKLSELKNQGMIDVRDEAKDEDRINPDTVSAGFLNKADEIRRQYLRWGIKGHRNLGVKYESEVVKCGPLEYTVPTWEMVEVYEGMQDGLFFGWLAEEVREFNTLGTKKKSRSSPTSGDRTPTSSAGDANETRT